MAALLPDPGSVMSGDFGEIVGYLYLASRQAGMIGPKNGALSRTERRLRHILTSSNSFSRNGQRQVRKIAWCAVKPKQKRLRETRAIRRTSVSPWFFAPIPAAIEGSQTDRTSRLSRTLVWLRERSLLQDMGAITVDQLNRFINATEFPACVREFHAIAVICSNLVATELANLVPGTIPAGCALAVISVPNLRTTYTTVFEAVHASVIAVPEALP